MASSIIKDNEPDAVRVEKKGTVTTIIINRPGARNAVDGITAIKLANAFRNFEADEEARVAVLFGSGGVFCAGADLKAIATQSVPNPTTPPVATGGVPGGAQPEADRRAWLTAENDGPMGPSRMLLSKPVIGAVEGFAVAGGLELACWCDLRVADETAVFGVFCRRWGVPLIDGGTIRLPRIIGQGRAMDMVLTGRAVNAQEALSFGLANRVVPRGTARAEAEKLAFEIAQFPQPTMRRDRMSAYMQDGMSIQNALHYEFENGVPMVMEGVKGATKFSGGAGRGGSFSDFKAPAAIPRATVKSSSPIKGVLFDIGGVVCGSPLAGISKYQRDNGIASGSLGKVFVKSRAFMLLETGKVDTQQFYPMFEAECKEAGLTVDAQKLFKIMTDQARPRPSMVKALQRLRMAGIKTVAITNNWKERMSDSRGSGMDILEPMFDSMVESCIIGDRKPSEAIFKMALKQLGLEPQQCAFLDDLGANLSGARKLGIHTIKVDMDETVALQQLQQLVGVDLGLENAAVPRSRL